MKEYYPPVYHNAVRYLVAHGAHGPNNALARKDIARALRAIRNRLGREIARQERNHLLFIAGMFPTKG